MKKAISIEKTAAILSGGLGVLCVFGLVGGWLWGSWLIASAAASIGLCSFGLTTAPFRERGQQSIPKQPDTLPKIDTAGVTVTRKVRSKACTNARSMIEAMINEGRYALLLRPEIVDSLTNEQRQAAQTALTDAMSPTPAGRVLLYGREFHSTHDIASSRTVEVQAFYLDRYPVTNAQYQLFVLAGGYRESSLWDDDVWPLVAEFVDQTGAAGPKFWLAGSFPNGQERHPVVGINWYEASAYARWVGKRLPSDPEWVKAAAWPLPARGGGLLQSSFPWGDTMNRRMANLWGCGPGTTVAVDEFPAAVSRGGVYQMIGNVWEWMHSDLSLWDNLRERLETSEPMKSIRGGAFDTYFDNQASCHFQSGDSCLARKHNIGLRCAIAEADLAIVQSPGDPTCSTESAIERSV